MPKTIPIALQDHLYGSGTTLCYLLKITTEAGVSFGMTSLQKSLTYDDGLGPLVYSAPIGLDQSTITTTGDMQVDNSEAVVLLANTGPVTPQMIEAGALDYATFVIYRVNWASLVTREHYIIQSGTTGAVKNRDGLSGVIELRGLPQKLKQTYNELYSITCRAVFGSQAGAEIYPCNFIADALWSSKSVATVDTVEPDRVFTSNTTATATGPNGALTFEPGIIRWLTGANANAVSEVETLAGVAITLRFPTWYPIVAADTFKIRPDCGKRFAEDCIAKYANYLNFRGEPLIPLGDESSQSAPGATLAIDLGIYRNEATAPAAPPP